MALARIYYNSNVFQSVLSMQVAQIKSEILGYTTTITDIYNVTGANITTAIGNIADSTLTAIFVCALTNATSATSKISYDQLALLETKLVTGSKGVVVTTGTAESNSTQTNIILAAASASAVDDTYNGKYIITAGTTPIARYISDYTGSTRICTVVATGTAITTTETYTIRTPSVHVYLIGDSVSSENSVRVAWRSCFSNKQFPILVNLLGGSGTIAIGLNGVVDGVTTFKPNIVTTATATSAGATSLTHTGQFVASAMIGKWLGIESGTLGVGQVRKITANTADILTVDAWTTTPTGTVVYCISETYELCLAHIYLPYAISTYLASTSSDVHAEWKKLFDKYNTLHKSTTRLDGDFELLKVYLQRGKCIFDAKAAGVVS